MDLYEKNKIKTKRYIKIKALLQKIYGFNTFKPKQYEIINRIVSGEDICAVLPTGYGKSLTFQIPALYLQKPAIIIVPLISLMEDQKIGLEKIGINACCYNHYVSDKKTLHREILEGKYQFIYIAPESLTKIKSLLEKLAETIGISLFAIDEAHCISSYGLQFRRSYRELTFIKDVFPNIPILAVTATATNLVSADICKVLKLSNNDPIKTSFDRPNLYLEWKRKSKNVEADLLPILNKYSDQSSIIYCLTKKETVKIQQIIANAGISCGLYHSDVDEDEKKKTHLDFVDNKIKCVIATIAFGMGINKPDVRVIIHYGAPKNVEGYYQEIGRAGRDMQKSYCYAFFGDRDFQIQESFIMSIQDILVRKHQLTLLEEMRKFAKTTECRRKILLKYFGEANRPNCNFCDNCCGADQEIVSQITKTAQNVEKETKLLLMLIESIKGRSFGLSMYINILRGSVSKTIPDIYKKSNFHGLGKYRSTVWWKELGEHLIRIGLLQQVHIRGKFMMNVIKVSQKGIMWMNTEELKNLLGDINVNNNESDTLQLHSVAMQCDC